MPDYDNKNRYSDNKAVQREAVFQGAGRESSALLRRLTPANKIINYDESFDEAVEARQAAKNLVIREGAKAYELIIGMILTAQTSEQLQNSFGILGAIERSEEYGSEMMRTGNKARIDFLTKHSKAFAEIITDQAAVVKSKLISEWNEKMAGYYERLFSAWFSPSPPGPYYNKGVENGWAEAFVATVLDGTAPFGLRMALLSASRSYGYGGNNFRDNRFNVQEISAGKAFKLSWLYGKEKIGDSRDEEIAWLREQVRKMEQMREQVEARRNTTDNEKNYEKEIERLRKIAQDALGMARMMAQKAELYRVMGGSPLVPLGITQEELDKAPEKKQFIEDAYRKRVRDFHPDLHRDDDPVMARLRGEEMTRLNTARDYLKSSF